MTLMVIAVANVLDNSTGGGVIDVGAAFGAAAPYINSIIGLLITSGLSWLFIQLKNKFNIDIDAGHRNAIIQATQRQASSLIADGAVKFEDKGIAVDSAALAAAANEVIAVLPDAAAHFGLTPNAVAARIKDAIPQLASVAPALVSTLAK